MLPPPSQRSPRAGLLSAGSTRSALLALTLAACTLSGDPEPWLLASPGQSTPMPEVDTHVLAYVRSLGPLVLPPSFTYLGPAGEGDGTLAVWSHKDCTAAVLDIATGERLRSFGRCGNGPHEARVISALTMLGDSVVIVDVGLGRVRLFGPADTTVRTVRLQALSDGGTRSIHGFHLLDDSSALVSMVRLPAAAAAPDQHGMLAVLDLHSGALRRTLFEEPVTRRHTAPDETRFYGACAARGGAGIALENNGPAEVLSLDERGGVRWAYTVDVEGIRFGRGLEPTASFRWHRFPRKPVCTRTAVVSLFLQGLVDDLVGEHLGRIAAVDWSGRPLLNQSIPRSDSLLAYAGWYGGDSLVYVATTTAPAPRVLVLKLRPRRPGEVGPIQLPDAVRDSMAANILLSDGPQ